MIKLGLTGNIACGKSLIEAYLKEMDIPVLDADEIVHDLYKKKDFQSKIINIFKEEDIFENQEISRKKIGSIVFKDKDKLKKLESILQPEVKNRIEIFFKENKNKQMACASLPLLFEANMQNEFDFVVTVFAKQDQQIDRILDRNNLSEKEALERINSQMPQESKKELADFIINNSLSKENTKQQLIKIVEKLKNN